MLFISIYFLMQSSIFCPEKDEVGTVDAQVYFNKAGRNPEMMFSGRFLWHTVLKNLLKVSSKTVEGIFPGDNGAGSDMTFVRDELLLFSEIKNLVKRGIMTSIYKSVS